MVWSFGKPSMFGSVFSGQDGNQNRNQTIFDFRFGFFRFRFSGFSFSFFSVSVWFGLVFTHLPLTIPSNQTRPKCMVKFHQISFQFLQSQIPWWISIPSNCIPQTKRRLRIYVDHLMGLIKVFHSHTSKYFIDMMA